MGSEPYLSRTTDRFDEAYPEIATIEVIVESGDMIWGTRDSWKLGTAHFTKANMRDHVPCSNTNCRRGGLDLGRLVSQMVAGRQTQLKENFRCRGDEGSPKGRRQGPSCTDSFKVDIQITYKPGSKN